MFNRHKGKNAIVPSPSAPIKNYFSTTRFPIKNISNKIKPDPDKNLSLEILNQMRAEKQITNEAYMQLAILQQILDQLVSINVNTRANAISAELTGKFILNKFSWV